MKKEKRNKDEEKEEKRRKHVKEKRRERSMKRRDEKGGQHISQVCHKEHVIVTKMTASSFKPLSVGSAHLTRIKAVFTREN